MEFKIALENVFITLLYLLPGFVFGKIKILKTEHLPTLSGVLIYLSSPCMIISSFLALEYSNQNLLNMGLFFIITFILQAVCMLLIYYCLGKKGSAVNKNVLLALGSTMGNVGFFGLPVIKAIFPNNPEVACYSCVYTLSMNILVFTLGLFLLTKDKKFVSFKKAVLNPATIATVIALPLFLFGLGKYIPSSLNGAVSLLGKMTTPLCMIILGVRLSQIPLKQVITSKWAYLVSAGKLVIFPLLCYLAVYFLPLDQVFKASVLILSATPCAAINLNLAELYNVNREGFATSIFISNILCIIFLPLLTLLI